VTRGEMRELTSTRETEGIDEILVTSAEARAQLLVLAQVLVQVRVPVLSPGMTVGSMIEIVGTRGRQD
jgi:hypothetical protein